MLLQPTPDQRPLPPELPRHARHVPVVLAQQSLQHLAGRRLTFIIGARARSHVQQAIVASRRRHDELSGVRKPADLANRNRQSDVHDIGHHRDGCFIGAYATNPVNGEKVPVFIADYVLMGYGTGAIMAVPGEDQRDWDFAKAYDLRIIETTQRPEGWTGEAYSGDGPKVNSDWLNGLEKEEAIERAIQWLEDNGIGKRTVTVSPEAHERVRLA